MVWHIVSHMCWQLLGFWLCYFSRPLVDCCWNNTGVYFYHFVYVWEQDLMGMMKSNVVHQISGIEWHDIQNTSQQGVVCNSVMSLSVSQLTEKTTLLTCVTSNVWQIWWVTSWFIFPSGAVLRRWCHGRRLFRGQTRMSKWSLLQLLVLRLQHVQHVQQM
jgi:hypothetical protein